MRTKGIQIFATKGNDFNGCRNGMKKLYNQGKMPKSVLNSVLEAISEVEDEFKLEKHSTKETAIEFGNIMKAINATRDKT